MINNNVTNLIILFFNYQSLSRHFKKKNSKDFQDRTDIGIDFFLNIKHMSYVSSGNKGIFYVEFVSMKKNKLFFLWFFVFGCFYSYFRHFIKNGKNKKKIKIHSITFTIYLSYKSN